MEEANQKHEPIQQSVRVDCPIDDAFRLFTENTAEWWPSAEQLDRESVIAWDPPHHVAFVWHEDQTVDVEFRVEGDGTRVTLTHHGWYMDGSPTCLSRFAEFAAAQACVMA
jgi:hypothetical protein